MMMAKNKEVGSRGVVKRENWVVVAGEGKWNQTTNKDKANRAK